jgi:hypothetical protein
VSSSFSPFFIGVFKLLPLLPWCLQAYPLSSLVSSSFSPFFLGVFKLLPLLPWRLQASPPSSLVSSSFSPFFLGFIFHTHISFPSKIRDMLHVFPVDGNVSSTQRDSNKT